MSLNGYRRSYGKRSGGLRSVALIEAESVLSVIYDRRNNVYSQVVLKENSSFQDYEFREGEASFSEEITTIDGVVRVRHKISFSLERPDRNSGDALKRIIEASANGMICIVTTNNGVSLLVGFSEKFGTEQALKLSESSSATGRKFEDMTLETITLASEDCDKALVYETGTF